MESLTETRVWTLVSTPSCTQDSADSAPATKPYRSHQHIVVVLQNPREISQRKCEKDFSRVTETQGSNGTSSFAFSSFELINDIWGFNRYNNASPGPPQNKTRKTWKRFLQSLLVVSVVYLAERAMGLSHERATKGDQQLTSMPTVHMYTNMCVLQVLMGVWFTLSKLSSAYHLRCVGAT